jgi:hypothetical protein
MKDVIECLAAVIAGMVLTAVVVVVGVVVTVLTTAASVMAVVIATAAALQLRCGSDRACPREILEVQG